MGWFNPIFNAPNKWQSHFSNSEGASARSAGHNRNAIWKYGSRGAYTDWVKKALPGMLGLYEPTRIGAADQAAMGEQNNLGQVNAIAARSGLTGSGAHLMARAGVRGERQANVNEALMQKYLNTIGMVEKQAGATLGTAQNALAGQPYNQNAPYSQWGQQIAPYAQRGVASWLASYQQPAQTSGVNSNNPYSYIGADYRPTY